MQFTKMQGAGNDYVYVNCFSESLPCAPETLAREVADRHFGIGGDGLILIGPSECADAKMTMFNADGSQSEMCGNGVRCVAKYVYDHGICRSSRLKIETGRGVLTLDLETAAGKVQRVTVDMGRPILTASEIPTTLTGNPVLNQSLNVGGKTFQVTCVSMGNPHCVTYVEELNDDWVKRIGPLVEVDRHFPRRVNAEFVQVVSANEVRARVWERGSGETLACGTGASAICVAGVLTGRTQRQIKVHLPGGALELQWQENDHVFLTGPAVEVFQGEWQRLPT